MSLSFRVLKEGAMSKGFQKLLFVEESIHHVSQERAQELIEPLLQSLTRAMFGAFDQFRDDVGKDTHAVLSRRVKGSNVTDLIWEHVRDNLTGEPGVQFCDKLNFFKVVVANELVIRFKRLSSDLLVLPSHTVQAVSWFCNEPIDGFDNNLLRVNFGYRPERDWLSCKEFFLTHQSSTKSICWSSRLELADETLPFSSEASDKPHGLSAIKIIPVQVSKAQAKGFA